MGISVCSGVIAVLPLRRRSYVTGNGGIPCHIAFIDVKAEQAITHRTDEEPAPMTTAAHATTVNARVSTRALLGSAAAAAPLWAVLSLTQAATREGSSL